MESIETFELREKVYNVYQCEIEDKTWMKLLKEKAKLRKKGSEYLYEIICAFDIETTQIPYRKSGDEFIIYKEYYTKELEVYKNNPASFMWCWQMAFYIGDDEFLIYERRWERFLLLMESLQNVFHLNEKKRLVIYVHNLAYEFQYIQDFFTWTTVFARQPRRVMKAECCEGFEFRCSYYLSNMSLEKFCKNTSHVFHQKMKGDLDYSQYRDDKTNVTYEEFRYCINDVLGLVEAVYSKMIDENDTIFSIPLTSTGYVRRDVRNYAFDNGGWGYKKIIKKGFPEAEVYELCRAAFRGGDTHANYRLADKELTSIYSKDIKSSYPAWMCYEEFPIGKAQEYTIYDLDRLIELMDEKLLVMEIDFFDLEVESDIAMPYIDFAHVKNYRKIERDNGRILKAEYIHYYCTSIDLKIILEQYAFSGINITKCFGWCKCKLPQQIRYMVMEYFRKKTEVDGIKNMHYEYVKAKNKLNAIFGMMVTPYDMWEVVYRQNENDWDIVKGELEEKLEKVFKSYNTFLLYQWGMFITAYARWHLHKMLFKIGLDAVYIDTDSIKFRGAHNLKYFEQENKEIMRLAEENDTIAYNPDGKAEVLGLWENDLEDYDVETYEEFKTLGAKKYCYKVNGKYTVTVSGMNKEKGSAKIKSMDDFTIGKEFSDIGRKTVWYNDKPPFYTDLKGSHLLITPNVGMIETTYTLGVDGDYLGLIKKILDNS